MSDSNTYTGKRVELHCHSKFGSIGAVNSAAEIVKLAHAQKMSAVAITDIGVAYAFPEAEEARKALWSACVKRCQAAGTDPGAEIDFFKVIYGMETRLLRRTPECRERGGYSIVLLVRNEIGRRNLYHLITDCSGKPAAVSHPRASERELEEYREGLLVGSAGVDGEIFQAILEGKSGEEIQTLAEFYDYLEIQPVSCNDQEIMTRVQTVNQKIVELGDLLHIPVIAASNAYLLDAKDELGWRILRWGKGVQTTENAIPPYFRSTEEMLHEFRYLGKEKAAEVVITNTSRIADKIDAIRPVPSGRHLLRAPGSDSVLRKACTEKIHKLYRKQLPEIVESRLNRELETIIRKGYAETFLLLQKIVQKSTSNGYCVISRSTLGASFVAYLLGIVEGNPLPPHYRCTKCFYTDFESGPVLQSFGGTGFDLPDKCCPCCGAPLKKDGLSIPFETFMGLNGEKEQAFSLNFSEEHLAEIRKYTGELLGENRLIRSGRLQTKSERSAYGLVCTYLDEHGIRKDGTELAHFVELCADTIHGRSYQPWGFFLLPDGVDIYDFTPLQRHPRRGKAAFADTHFEGRALRHSFLRLDELGHSTSTMLHELQALTDITPAQIPFDDQKVLSLFSSPKALGLTPENIFGWKTGTLGIPEFENKFMEELLTEIQPRRFSDLIRALGLAHGTGAWADNTQDLLKNGVCSLSSAICCKDDIWNELRRRGVAADTAFGIMENAGNGRIAAGICDQWENWKQELNNHNVPLWYIHSCEKMRYLFPKAQNAAYTIAAWKLAFFKLYYPLEFYTAYFNVIADRIPFEQICQGEASLNTYYKWLVSEQLEKSRDMVDLRIVQEMYARGFEFWPLNANTADADKYKIIGGKIMPPFSGNLSLIE